MNNKRQVIPGTFTTMNLFCGFLAITKISDGLIVQGCWLIVFATIFDLLDGQFARLTKSASDFGVEFDSLADVVSFGIAPSFLLYHSYFQKLGILGILISFSPLVAGAFRLARYNIQLVGIEKTNFSGLPVPMAAISFASFVIMNYNYWDKIRLTRLMVPMVILLSVLMVSNVEYYTLPKLTFRMGRRHSSLIIVMFVLLILIMFFPHEMLYPACVLYVIWGLIRYMYIIFKTSEEGPRVIRRKREKK